MPKLNLVMFDYDGVIADSLEVCYSSFQAACSETGLMEVKSKEEFVSLFDDNLYQSMAARGLTVEEINRIMAVYEVKQAALLPNLGLFPGIGEALRLISENNKVVVITSNLSKATAEILEKNGIHCCAGIIGADQEKSKIKKIHMAKGHYPDLPGFYVGDTKGDMIEGHKAETQTVGVCWGWHSPETLRAGGADFLAADPAELVQIVSV